MTRDINKIAIFDFDGTLIETPIPQIGRKMYEETIGVSWPYKGWWGHKESLDMNVFDMPVNETVVQDYNNEKTNLNTLMVLLTGRPQKLSDVIEDILKKNNLIFDEYYYNTGGRTDTNKLKTLDNLLSKYPNLDLVEMWDDRLEHIPSFEIWGKENVLLGKMKDFKINVIFSNQY